MTVRLINNILLGNLLMTPLLGYYQGLGYEQIKVLFFILSLVLIGLGWRKIKFKITPISILGGIFILVIIATSFIGIDFQSSLLGKPPYFQGVILYIFLYFFYLLVTSFKIEFKQYAVVITISATVVSLSAISDWLSLNIFQQLVSTYAGRVVATFGQPNFYAGFLLLTLPFSYFLLNYHRNNFRWLGFVGGLTSMIAILMSYSRLAIILALLLFVLGLIKQFKIKLVFFIITILSITLMLVIVILLSLKYQSGLMYTEIVQPIQVKNPDLTRKSVESRVYIWPQAVKVAIQKPVIGYGLENINTAFSNYFIQYKHQIFEENLNIYPVLISLKDLNIDRTHNYLIDLLLFSGILGVVGWLSLVVLLLRKGKGVVLVSLITYLVWVQFHNQSIVQLIFFWLLVGLIDKKINTGC